MVGDRFQLHTAVVKTAITLQTLIAIIKLSIITHLTTDSLPAALSIICHGNVESNIAFLKTLVDNVKGSKLAVV